MPTKKLDCKEYQEIIAGLAKTIEKHDSYTALHQKQVAKLAKAIAKELNLSEKQINTVYLSSLIHDIGKIYIDSNILNKKKPLNDQERLVMRKHVLDGYNIVKDIQFPCPIAQVLLQHHERLDGSGYPQELKEDEILIEAKILAVADVVETMAHDRPYRQALGLSQALYEVEQNRGKLYDPRVVDASLKLFKEKKFQF